MRALVDTSVWSLALRRSGSARNLEVMELRRLINAHLVEIIGPIRQEVLSGIRNAPQLGRMEVSLAAFPDIILETKDYVTAAKFFNLCRAKGIQGSNTDFLICAAAVRNGLSIFTNDRDFTHFAKCLPIVLHEFKTTTVEGKREHVSLHNDT